MKFFLDNTSPREFAQSFRAFGYDITHLQEITDFKSGPATTDEEWVPYAAGKGMVALTSDRRLATRQIFKTVRLTTFFMPKRFTTMRLWDQYGHFVGAWEAIRAMAERANTGDCWDVSEGGKVTLFGVKRR